jgi:dTDP-4-amino-4,6-dideoxygalactose transaminase
VTTQTFLEKGAKQPASANERIPLVDLSMQHEEVVGDMQIGLQETMARGDFILGRAVHEFETAFASFCTTRFCVGVGSGTDAVEFALRATGVGPGDEVILPTNSFVATAFAAMRAGANPVLVDAEERYLLIDWSQVADRVTSRTRAIVPVHLYGQMAEMPQLGDVLDSCPDIAIVEDAAQAQGASRFGRSAGSVGLAGAMSFYPSKNLGAYGDGGAVLTDSAEVAGRVRRLRNFGSEQKYVQDEVGFNSRLDSLQATVLLVKLQRLETWNRARAQAAAFYTELLQDLDDVRCPAISDGNVHSWHLYVVRVPRRDDVVDRMRAAGVHVGIHYPVPIHLQRPFQARYRRGDFPISERAAGEVLSLPLYPGIRSDQQERVVQELIKSL